MQRQAHWNAVYDTRHEQQVSWFEELPALSLRMMESAGLTPDTCVIDVGGGCSRLVDQLVARKLTCLAILDVSGSALRHAKARLGDAASIPMWIEGDVTADWSVEPMDIWHDRAVFHFLTHPADRACYRSRLLATLKPGGTAIVATFALHGPEKCSGLPVQRYSAETLSAEFSPDLQLIESVAHVHRTPSGGAQDFVYCRLRRVI
jgi:trans-aconitate methyltransferase